MQETWSQSQGWEDFLEEGMATYSSIIAWRIQAIMDRVSYRPWGCKELDMAEATEHTCVESGKTVLMNLFTGKQWRRRYRGQTCGHMREGEGGMS